jgi:cytolysin-activating lysine-acyltransferase
VEPPVSVRANLVANTWPFRQWPRRDIKQHGQTQGDAFPSASNLANAVVGQSLNRHMEKIMNSEPAHHRLANGPSDRFPVLGKIAWVWMNSPLHVSWTVDLLARFILPAIESNQYMLIERDGYPVAYCSWAFLTKTAEFKYMVDPSDIHVDEWVGGDRLWFVDWVAPFSKDDSLSMKNKLIDEFPNSLARAIRVKKNKTNARVMEFRGRKLDPALAATLRDRYYRDFLDIAKQENAIFKNKNEPSVPPY